MLKKKAHILWGMWCPLFLVLLWQVYILSVVDKVHYMDRIQYVYAQRLDGLSEHFDLPASYLKALLILECSGKYNVPSRYEKHLFAKFKKVRAGTLSSYNGITRKMIKNASDAALKNMATSWGPFQIMGSHALMLGVNVRNLRGFNSLYWGVKWINDNYGDYLRKGKFKDAFHLHNAGKPFPADGVPRTHDPDYVYNGLKYMKYFEELGR